MRSNLKLKVYILIMVSKKEYHHEYYIKQRNAIKELLTKEEVELTDEEKIQFKKLYKKFKNPTQKKYSRKTAGLEIIRESVIISFD